MNNQQLFREFKNYFGQMPKNLSVSPGRVNLIGEHTDYNQGLVLPCALEFCSRIAYATCTNNNITAYSIQYPNQRDIFSVDKEITPGDLQWGNYVRSVVYALKKNGFDIGGLNILISSDVPQGAGLSSSAALEISLIGAFNEAFDLALDELTIALLGQQAENEFMGCNCGIMDQLISVQGKKNQALLIDCRNHITTTCSIPNNLEILIIDSNHPHSLIDSEYNLRREDCMSAAAKLRKPSLREVQIDSLESAKSILTENEFKRSFHVLTENYRVSQMVKALSDNDIASLSAAMADSHQSLRLNYEVTIPAIDWIVNTVSHVLGQKGGVRMTGGGFGGSVVCLCPANLLDAVKSSVVAGYEKATGLRASFHRCRAGDGLRIEHVI